MKKILPLILISLFAVNAFSQNISKEVPEKNKFDYFYLKERYILSNRTILAIYDLKKERKIRLDLFNENFDEIKSIEIKKDDNAQYYTYLVEGDFLYITNKFKKPKKNPGIQMIRVSLDGIFTENKYTLAKALKIATDASNKFCYYREQGTGNLVKFDLETKEEINIDLNNETNGSLRFSEILTFQNNSDVIISKYKHTDELEKDKYSTALYDQNGKEKSSFNHFENNNYKAKIFYANNQGEIISSGNFIKEPTIDDIFYNRNAKVSVKKREFDGIYLRTLNSEKKIEKYYEYSAFPNLFKAINSDKKDAKQIKNLTYAMEDILKVNGEYISIGTINENKYELTNSHDGKHLVTTLTGTSMKYILIFGFNTDGEITWEKILSPDWDYTRNKYDRISDIAEAGDLITIKQNDNKITCHFSLIDKIHYFEIIDEEISNYKQTEYEFKIGSNRLKDKKAKDLDQHKDSFYWYGNFYCSYLLHFTDKHTLFNKTEF